MLRQDQEIQVREMHNITSDTLKGLSFFRLHFLAGYRCVKS